MQVDPASRQIVTVLALKLTHSLWDRWSRHKNDYTLSKRHQTSFEPLIKSVWKLQRKRKTGTVQLYPASNILHLSSIRYPLFWNSCGVFVSPFLFLSIQTVPAPGRWWQSTTRILTSYVWVHLILNDFCFGELLKIMDASVTWFLTESILTCPITTTCHTVNPTCSLRVSCPGDLHHI